MGRQPSLYGRRGDARRAARNRRGERMHVEQRAYAVYDTGASGGKTRSLRKAHGAQRAGGAEDARYGKGVQQKTHDRVCAKIRKRYAGHARFYRWRRARGDLLRQSDVSAQERKPGRLVRRQVSVGRRSAHRSGRARHRSDPLSHGESQTRFRVRGDFPQAGRQERAERFGRIFFGIQVGRRSVRCGGPRDCAHSLRERRGTERGGEFLPESEKRRRESGAVRNARRNVPRS